MPAATSTNGKNDVLYTVEAGWWINSRGQRLYTLCYEPPAPRAAVFFHHGYSEYLGWCKRLFVLLAEAGFAVYGFDAHGHGRSEPSAPSQRVYFRNIDHLVDDALGILDDIVLPRIAAAAERNHAKTAGTEQASGKHAATPPPLPLFGLAHSFGSTVLALVQTARPGGVFAGLGFNSPAIGVQMTLLMHIQHMFASLLLALVPGQRIVPGRLPHECFCDARIARATTADPLFQNGNLRVSTAATILAGFARVRQTSPQISCPVYVQWAGRDVVSDRHSAKVFVESVASKDVVWDEAPQDMHASIHSTQRAGVLINALRLWMERVLEDRAALRGGPIAAAVAEQLTN